MDREEVELKLLKDYLEAADQSNDPQELAQRITVYEKQILSCKQQRFDFNWPWIDSMVYYLKARQKLLGEGFMEKTLRSTARQSSGFDGIAPALLAKEGEKGRAREAISLLTQAIQLYDDPDYRFLRANLYNYLKEKPSALRDVEHLLATAGDDQNQYFEARKLKDEIETSKSGCFIATAVYTPSEVAKIDILRDYRDRVLLKSALGKIFVYLYYAISPSIARIISKSQMLKSTVRTLLLDPIVKWVLRAKSN